MVKNVKHKGKGSSTKRKEKRTNKFKAPAKRNNILREDAAEKKKERRQEANTGFGLGGPPKQKKFQEKPFARPAKPAAKDNSQAIPDVPLSRKELKQATEAWKAKRKPNYSTVQNITATWEKLRRLDLKKEERDRLVARRPAPPPPPGEAEVWVAARGKAKTLAMNHKSSRVLQSILKWGTDEQKAGLVDEILPNLVELAKDTYGTHLARKIVDTAGKPELPNLLKAVKGHCVQLARHPHGAPVLDALYVKLPSSKRASVLSEFYGREFQLLLLQERSAGQQKQKPRALSLADAVAQDPPKKRPILQHVEITIGPILEKGLVSYNYVHRILAEFLSLTGPAGAADIAQSVTGPALLRMIHTTDGVRAASALLGAATAKERKALLKAVKGRVLDIAKDECGHVVLLAALECVDDTQLLSKAILSELLPHLAEVACHRFARRLLLNLLSPRNPRYLPAAVIDALPKAAEGGGAPPQARGYESEDEDGDGVGGQSGSDSDGAGDDDDFVTRKGAGKPAATGDDDDDDEDEEEEEEEDGDDDDEEEEGAGRGAKEAQAQAPTSKKPAHVRRAELLGKAGRLGEALAALCASGAWMLMRSALGADVLFEVARGGEGGELLRAVGAEKVAAVRRAVAQEAALEASAERSAPGGASASAPGKKDPAFMRGGLEAAVAGAGKLAAAAQAEALWAQPGDSAGDNFVASRLLRRLALEPAAPAEAADAAAGLRGVGPLLWESALKGRCKAWVAGHRAKVTAAVASCGDAAVEKAAGAELAPLVKPKSVAAWAKQFAGQEHGEGADAEAPRKQAKKRPAAEGGAGGEAPAGEEAPPPAKKGAAAAKGGKRGAAAAPAGEAAEPAPASAAAGRRKAAAGAAGATAAAGGGAKKGGKKGGQEDAAPAQPPAPSSGAAAGTRASTRAKKAVAR